MDTAEPDAPGGSMATNEKSLHISVEGWQLVLAVFAVLGGSYYFTWDSYKTLLIEVSVMRAEQKVDRQASDDRLVKFMESQKTDRAEENRQAREDKKALDEKLSEIHDALIVATEALKRKK